MALRQVYTKLQLAVGRAWPQSSPSQLQLLASSSMPLKDVTAGCFSGCPLGSQAGIRGYMGTGYPDLPTRRHVFAELPLISEMLPNRKHFAAQFSPHGITLVPKAICVVGDTAPVIRDGRSIVPKPAMEEPEYKIQQAPMQAIGIKTWRRLRMKKHKIKKRKKANRMQVK